ncbi:hypothetical protein B8W74_05210 [Arthrobacter agilis]|nr:hypothetical protein B8W74_05210 [Arthrobacter agilis]
MHDRNRRSHGTQRTVLRPPAGRGIDTSRRATAGDYAPTGGVGGAGRGRTLAPRHGTTRPAGSGGARGTATAGTRPGPGGPAADGAGASPGGGAPPRR